MKFLQTHLIIDYKQYICINKRKILSKNYKNTHFILYIVYVV